MAIHALRDALGRKIEGTRIDFPTLPGVGGPIRPFGNYHIDFQVSVCVTAYLRMEYTCNRHLVSTIFAVRRTLVLLQVLPPRLILHSRLVELNGFQSVMTCIRSRRDSDGILRSEVEKCRNLARFCVGSWFTVS